MKCKVFLGPWNQAQDAFNRWAKDKALAKNVIIHTDAFFVPRADGPTYYLCITVYHPDDEYWDTGYY